MGAGEATCLKSESSPPAACMSPVSLASSYPSPWPRLSSSPGAAAVCVFWADSAAPAADLASRAGSMRRLTSVALGPGLGSFVLTGSRFFSAVRRKTLIVVRSALWGLQSSADRGECSQTGHDEGSVD